MQDKPVDPQPKELVGRYLQKLDGKTIGDLNNDAAFAMTMLYLQLSGAFLLCGTWPRFEHTFVAGQWMLSGQQLHLNGRGVSYSDVGVNYEDDVFERVLEIGEQEGIRTLTTDVELELWSLLSYPGVFRFIGHENVGVPQKMRFPETDDEIEQRISEIMSSGQRKL